MEVQAPDDEVYNPAISDGKAIAFGVFVTIVLAATMVVAGLKAGITPGASTLVVLCAWAVFGKHVKGSGGRRFLNLAQVAGSSGMASVSGVIFTAPLLFHMHLNLAQVAVNKAYNLTAANETTDLKTIDWIDAKMLIEAHYPDFPSISAPTMMIFTVAGALIGFGFVGISTKKFLSDPTLPAPEAHACNTMVKASAADAALQPAMGRSLVLSTAFSFILPLLFSLGIAAKNITIYYRKFSSGKSFAIVFPCSPVYIGIGGLLTLSVAIVTCLGAFTRLIGDLVVAPLDGDAAIQYPPATMRWIGGGAMTVGVVFSLIKFMSPRVAGEGENGDAALLDIPQKMMVMLYGAIAGGLLLLTTGIFTVGSDDILYGIIMLITIFIMASLMVTLGAILSLQIGSSASPVSGTVFVTTLVICLICLAYRIGTDSTVPPIVQVGGISYMLVTACVAVSAANDSSQDYKTLQLGGIAPRDGFLAQLLGLVFGAITVPISYLIAHSAYGLGTNNLPAPQGELFSVIIEGILVDQTIPWYPVIIGLTLGAAAVGIELLAAKNDMQLPAMAFAVGLYLPPDLGLGIIFGAGFRYLGERAYERDNGKQERTYESILSAAGMITGAAIYDLVIGMAVALASFNPNSLCLSPDGCKVKQNDGFFEDAPFQSSLVAMPHVLFIGAIFYYNSRYGVPEATEQPALNQQLSTAKSLNLSTMSSPLVSPTIHQDGLPAAA